MRKRTVKNTKTSIRRLPKDKPVVYKIKTDGGTVNYVGVAKKGRVHERIAEHLPGGRDRVPGAKVQIEQVGSIAQAKRIEAAAIKAIQPKYNKRSNTVQNLQKQQGGGRAGSSEAYCPQNETHMSDFEDASSRISPKQRVRKVLSSDLGFDLWKAFKWGGFTAVFIIFVWPIGFAVGSGGLLLYRLQKLIRYGFLRRKLENERKAYGITEKSPKVFVCHADRDRQSVLFLSVLVPSLYREGINVVQYYEFTWPDRSEVKVVHGAMNSSYMYKHKASPDAVKQGELVISIEGRTESEAVDDELSCANADSMRVIRVSLPSGVRNHYRNVVAEFQVDTDSTDAYISMAKSVAAHTRSVLRS
jgi:hypothetical protein